MCLVHYNILTVQCTCTCTVHIIHSSSVLHCKRPVAAYNFTAQPFIWWTARQRGSIPFCGQAISENTIWPTACWGWWGSSFFWKPLPTIQKYHCMYDQGRTFLTLCDRIRSALPKARHHQWMYACTVSIQSCQIIILILDPVHKSHDYRVGVPRLILNSLFWKLYNSQTK